MVLGFKEYFDKEKKKPTWFREKILASAQWYRMKLTVNGEDHYYYYVDFKTYNEEHRSNLTPQFVPKIHTIRQGHRWKAGDLMHMAYGVRTKNYQQFNKGIDALQRVVSVQDIRIPKDDMKGSGTTYVIPVYIDGKLFPHRRVNELAINDGFDDDGFGSAAIYFDNWFVDGIDGQIIHWTNLRY